MFNCDPLYSDNSEDEEGYIVCIYHSAQIINSDDVDVGCGHRKARKKLLRCKKSTEEGKLVLEAESFLLKNSTKKATSISQLVEIVNLQKNPSRTVRQFYSSLKRVRSDMSVQIQKERSLNKLFTKERRSLVKENGSKNNELLMFVGDRGTGVGSRIKGHRRYGGRWLEEKRGKRGVVCITNEHMTSQTCLYCFEKLEHPCQLITKQGKKKEKKVHGALLCVNPACISVKLGRSTKSRDALSALAIGLSGVSFCFLGETMPCFSPHKISQKVTESFKTIATNFLKGKAGLPVA